MSSLVVVEFYRRYHDSRGGVRVVLLGVPFAQAPGLHRLPVYVLMIEDTRENRDRNRRCGIPKHRGPYVAPTGKS